LQKGQWYRFSVRIRGRVADGAIDVALRNTAEWSELGLTDAYFLTDSWTTHESIFQATADSPPRHRLQLWWTSVGEVWFDEVTLEEVAPPAHGRTERIVATGARNKLPNGGFEAGPAGWGSVTEVAGWGGNLNRLVGEVVEQGAHSGRRCLRIPVRQDQLETVWFDYYDLVRVPVRRPLAAHRGWISVEPGQRYALSAWLRTEPAGTPAVMRVAMAAGRGAEQTVAVTGEWQRYQSASSPARSSATPRSGPTRPRRGAVGRRRDADPRRQPGATEPHAAVTIGAAPVLHGAFWAPGEPLEVELQIANETATSQRAAVVLTLTDAAGRAVETHREGLDLPAGAHRVSSFRRAVPAGFYRLKVTAEGATVVPPWPLRLAVATPNRRDETICGMNHGYPTAELLEQSKRIGLGWFRDWSLKWQQVEPEPGRFDFTETDLQIDRVVDRKLRVMGLLPFPSSVWASSLPAAEGTSYEARRRQVAQAPRDPAAFAEYVRRTVAHYRGRIDAFEMFNEPVYTSYSFPQQDGYTVADYVLWLGRAAQAAREANPQVFVIGGIQNLPGAMSTEFIAQGGLASIDAISIHSYPGKRPPESLIAPLAEMRAKMAAAGHPAMPIYWTEGAYYADDDKPREPYTGDWLRELPTEALATAFTIRLNAILCGYNTRRIIYHSGTPGQINAETLSGIFFEYDAAPRMMAPALAAFNALLGPEFVSHGAVVEGPVRYAYRFDSDGRTVIIAWTTDGSRPLATEPAGWSLLDLFGQPVGERSAGFGPVYLVGPRPGLAAPAALVG